LDGLVNPPLAAPPGSEIDRAWIDRAVTHAAERPEVSSTLQNLLAAHFADDERSLLLHLARAGGRLTSLEIPGESQAAVRTVAQRDYVTVHANGDVTLRVGVLQSWLSGRPLSGPIPLSPASGRAAPPTDVLIDEESQRVYVNGAEVKLTRLELRLLLYLGRHIEQVVSRDELAEHVWGKYDEGMDNARIDQAIARIRKKLNDDSKQQKYIETRAGTGYLLHNARFIPRQTQS